VLTGTMPGTTRAETATHTLPASYPATAQGSEQ
jgi:hypothetical protein